MAYVSGSAASLADLLTAIQAACTANGWLLRGNVLSRGACFVSIAQSGGDLNVIGGTGIGGANELTGASTSKMMLTDNYFTPIQTMPFPVSYHIHVNQAPDEVYVFVNYAVTTFQWVAFGCSPAPGISGTGSWFSASFSVAVRSRPDLRIGVQSIGQNGSDSAACPALFFGSPVSSSAVCGFVHHGLDGAGWSTAVVAGGNRCFAGGCVDPLLDRQPNSWNGETALLPIDPIVTRPSGKVSVVAKITHSRYVRNDNLADGEVVTLGLDRWKTYPWFRKNAAVRNGVNYQSDHSGTMGIAVRYDGP